MQPIHKLWPAALVAAALAVAMPACGDDNDAEQDVRDAVTELETEAEDLGEDIETESEDLREGVETESEDLRDELDDDDN